MSATGKSMPTSIGNIEIFTSIDRVHAYQRVAGTPPLFLSPYEKSFSKMDEFLDLIEKNRVQLGDLLVEHGGIVFRGFPISSTEDFDRLVTLLGPFGGGYIGGATARAKIKGNVMEATQLAAAMHIPLHQEMAYVPDYPGRIMFFCCRPAQQGGETTIGDMRRITAEFPRAVLEKLDALGTCGVRNYGPPAKEGKTFEIHPDQVPWTYAFETDSREELERICRSKGQETLWNEDGSVAIKARTSAFERHPVTHEKIYRSVVHLGDTYSHVPKTNDATAIKIEEMKSRQKNRTGYFLGDMSPLAADEMKSMNEAFIRNETSWKWQSGDVMLLDNLLMAHGRKPFVGTRDVQVGLLA